MTTRSLRFRTTLAVGLASLVGLAGCGGGSSSAPKVASLGTSATAASTQTTLSKKDAQDAILSFAKCMRDHGVDMPDPTFDANGNLTGRLFGPNSGVNTQDTVFRSAQASCRSLIQGVGFGGRGRRFDRAALQAAMNDFTSCLRSKGLDVNDVTLPQPGQGRNGTPGDGSRPPGGGGGGFGGTPGTGAGRTGNGAGGGGFNPATRMIQRLGLDQNDPKVSAAVTACQGVLQRAFTPTTQA